MWREDGKSLEVMPKIHTLLHVHVINHHSLQSKQNQLQVKAGEVPSSEAVSTHQIVHQCLKGGTEFSSL